MASSASTGAITCSTTAAPAAVSGVAHLYETPQLVTMQAGRHPPSQTIFDAKAYDDQGDLILRDERVRTMGEPQCQTLASGSVIARGFLQEGADVIAREIQLNDLSEDLLHFWAEPPRNGAEYYANIKRVSAIVVDPWFALECGRPSITALLKKITIGDYVAMPGHAQVWAESIEDVNKRAVQDRQWCEPHIEPYPGWRLEIMNMDYSNCRMLDNTAAGLATDEPHFRNVVDDELTHSVCANLRRNGFRAEYFGQGQDCRGNPGWRTYLDRGGRSRVVDLLEYYEGSGCERGWRLEKNGANYGAQLTPSRTRTW
jgi:hypothetical protein